MGNLLTGIVLMAVAGVLIFIGRPNRSGVHPRFLQFEAAMVLYPPVIMVFLVMGGAYVSTALLGLR